MTPPLLPLHALCFAAAFLIGAVPTGYLVVRLCRGRDIRESGSGNIGTTNVIRTEGLPLGLLVLFIDAGKAFAVAFFFSRLFGEPRLYRVLLGLTAIVGNMFTPFLRFRGGKGVGSGLGVAAAISPLALVISLAVFGGAVFTTRIVSVGSMAGAAIFALSSFLLYRFTGLGDVYGFAFSLLLFAAILFRHTSNLKRLFHGEESRI
jgi:glycerol-3-phosphate acyltransferase PlsY